MFNLVQESSTGFLGRRKKSPRKPFKKYYTQWITTLQTTLLPDLRRCLSSSSPATILSAHVDAVHRHFQSYYAALDHHAAADNLPLLLFPPWRNPLETPFLWLGDLHPYLFINLLRSLLLDNDTSADEEDTSASVRNFRNSMLRNENMAVMMAWKNGSEKLMMRVDQMECGVRLMVPCLAARGRHAQAGLVERVGRGWGGGMEGVVEEAVGEVVEEMVGVFVDANRLRSSVLCDILSATDVYQAAIFYEALSRFLVGFRDRKTVRDFGKCKKKIVD